MREGRVWHVIQQTVRGHDGSVIHHVFLDGMRISVSTSLPKIEVFVMSVMLEHDLYVGVMFDRGNIRVFRPLSFDEMRNNVG